jgi:hypothetical protein
VSSHVRNLVLMALVFAAVFVARCYSLPPLPDVLTGGKAILLGLAIEVVALVVWLQMNDVAKRLGLSGGVVTARPLIAVAFGIFGAIVVDEGFLDINAPAASRIMWSLLPLFIAGVVYTAGSGDAANGKTKKAA